MGRTSVKLAFHSVWGNGGFVCPALTAETISQLSPKDRKAFSLHLQPCGAVEASSPQPGKPEAAFSQPSTPQFLFPFGICSTPKPPGVLSPVSPADWHTSEQLCFAFPAGCTFHAPLLSLCHPQSLSYAGFQHSFP